jgi:hypothetical protein
VRNAAPPLSHPENFNPLSYARFIIQLILMMTWHSDDERSIERQTLEHRHEFGFGEKATSNSRPANAGEVAASTLVEKPFTGLHCPSPVPDDSRFS